MAEATDLSGAEHLRLRRLCVEVTPLQVGHRVKVQPDHPFAAEWPETYIITGIRWEYQRNTGHDLNISIASDAEIIERDGDTSGWRPGDLEFVRKA